MGGEVDISTLDDRIKIQKLVYLAQEFGVDLNYNYSMYVHGPYSPALADDYYAEQFREVESSLNPGFDMANYFDFVEGKSKEWLELATTIHKLYHNYKHFYQDDLVEEVVDAASNKKNAAKDQCRGILNDLGKAGLLD